MRSALKLLALEYPVPYTRCRIYGTGTMAKTEKTTTKRKVQNPLGLALMCMLFQRPMHPYEMATTLRERHKEESIKINYGSLYTVVGALERAGFIVARETVRESARPERTIYELTDEGRAELHDWLRDLLSTPVKEYPQFEAALSLMAVLPPEEVAPLLEQRARHLDEEAARLRAEVKALTKEGLERRHLIEAEYVIAMREAERAWVVKAAKLINESPDFTRTWKAWHTERAAAAAKEPTGSSKRRKKT